jgi:hypothetical protein
MAVTRAEANREAFRRLCESEPVLLDVLPAHEAVPGFTRDTILTSGPTLPWSAYIGGQRAAIIGGALFEGVARDVGDAERKLEAGEIKIRGCQELKCVGSLAGIYTASMPASESHFFATKARRPQSTFSKVLSCGVLPGMNIGVAGRDGGQIGAGTVQAPIECFEKAAAAFKRRYGNSF